MCCKARKSQYYVFGGIILISAVLVIITSASSIRLSRQEDSEDILENYMHEARIVIDSSIMQDSNTSEALSNYTESFIEYGKSRNLRLGIAYLYSKEGYIHIKNYLEEPVAINEDGTSVFPSEEKLFSYAESIELSYRNDTYIYAFSYPGRVEFKAFLVKKNG